MKVGAMIGDVDVLLMTLDTLRFDVAQSLWASGRTPNLASLLPETGWEARHTPGSFTWAAHHAFFAGFLPTPQGPGPHPRLFAARFPGSTSTTEDTFVFDAADLPTGLAQVGYHTICVGGTGFFNKQTPLGNAFPKLFHESHWSPQMGVTGPESPKEQFTRAAQSLQAVPKNQRTFLFINVSAIHQPNALFLPGATEDTVVSHAAALEAVDAQIPILRKALSQRGATLCILCADHGTAYGEDGYYGHRLGHPVVWTVPYTHFVLQGSTP